MKRLPIPNNSIISKNMDDCNPVCPINTLKKIRSGEVSLTFSGSLENHVFTQRGLDIELGIPVKLPQDA